MDWFNCAYMGGTRDSTLVQFALSLMSLLARTGVHPSHLSMCSYAFFSHMLCVSELCCMLVDLCIRAHVHTWQMMEAMIRNRATHGRRSACFQSFTQATPRCQRLLRSPWPAHLPVGALYVALFRSVVLLGLSNSEPAALNRIPPHWYALCQPIPVCISRTLMRSVA